MDISGALLQPNFSYRFLSSSSRIFRIFAIQFEILVLAIIVIVYFIDWHYANKGKKIHQLSFDEGSQLYTLEVEADEKISLIENNPLLIQKIYLKDNNLFSYKIASSSKTEIASIEKELENDINEEL